MTVGAWERGVCALPCGAHENTPIITVNAHRIETIRLLIKFNFRGRSLGAGEILTGLGGFFPGFRESVCVQSSHCLGLLPMYKRPPHPSRNCQRFSLLPGIRAPDIDWMSAPS